MSISATEATGMFGAPIGGTTTGDAGATTTTSKPADKEMFLQLLVAQLRYQDPSNPTDSSQFLAQSAQFTALEKMQAVADQTQQLLTAQMSFGASSLVGRTVTWVDADGTSTTGTVSGVNFSSAGPTLSINGASVPLGQVSSVTDGSTAPTGGSPTGTTPTTA